MKAQYLIPILFVALMALPLVTPAHAWWNTNYAYNIPINISTTTNLTYYQLAINVSYNAHMRPDFGDIRFINASDNAEYNYWTQSDVCITSNYCLFWVNGTFNTNNGTQLYMYYGNASATNASNVSATFITISGVTGSWLMDEPTGSLLAYDTSGNGQNGNNATRGGSAKSGFQTNGGVYSNSMNMTNDGSNDAGILINNSATMNNTFSGASYTVMGWFYAANTNGYDEIITKGGCGGAASDICLAWIGSTQRLSFNRGSTARLCNAGSIGTNGWSHLAVAENSTGTYFYLNGTLVCSNTTIAPITTTGNMRIGFDGNGNGQTAKYDVVQIYNTDLSASQINYLANISYITYTNGGNIPSIANITLIRKNAATVPTYLFGSETPLIPPSPAPVINITSPINVTYSDQNVTLASFKVTSLDTILNVSAYIDGALIYNNDAYSNNTVVNIYLNTYLSTSYNFTVNATDTAGISNTSVFFSIANPVYIIITLPTNTTYFGNTTISAIFNATTYSIPIFNLSAYLNGAQVYSNATYTNSSVIVLPLTVVGGTYNFTVNANTVDVSNTSSVYFTIWHGINLSTLLPNGTAIASWSYNATNGTNTTTGSGLSNPQQLEYSTLPQSNVTITVTKNGHDSDSWNTIINSTMGVQQHNFTLYPYSFIYFSNLTNWGLNFTAPNGTLYIATTVPGTYYNVSNRYLIAGNNVLEASKIGYALASVTQNIVASSSFNISLNTTQVGIIFRAYDEYTRISLPFNAIFNLLATNVTEYYLTSYRDPSNACLFDNDLSTSCLSNGVAAVGTSSVGYNTTQGFDYNDATFLLNWSGTRTGDGTGLCRVLVYLNYTTTIYDKSVACEGGTGDNTYLQVNNSNGNYSRTVPFTINVSVQYVAGTPGSSSVTTKVNEFAMVNNTAGYTYYSTNASDYRIIIPTLNIFGYSEYNAWFRGEETYAPLYTYQRMYRIALSPYANYNMNAYLLKDSLGYVQNFLVLDSNNNPINNALISISKWYDTIKTPVVQCGSNPAGACSVFIAPFVTYGFTAAATGYATKTNNTAFTGTPNPANIYLVSSAASNFTSVFQGLQLSLTPTNIYVSNATAQNTVCQIIATSGNLNYMNFSLYWTNSSGSENIANFTYTATVPSGGTISFPLANSGHYRARCSYEFVSNATGMATVYDNFNEITIWYTAATSPIPFDQATATVLALGLIAVICGIVGMYGGGTFAAGLGIMLMLLFAGFGFIDWGVTALSVLTVVALLMLRYGF